MDKKILYSILEAASRAPSGDNMQPWSCSWDNEKLLIRLAAGKDKSLYNFKEAGSYIACGAFIENLTIATEKHGFHAVLTYFPTLSDPYLVATITFLGTEPKENKLYTAIWKRATNRKPYLKKKLSDSDKTALEASVRDFPGVTLKLSTEREVVAKVSKAASLNERLLLENEAIHDMLFNSIRWSSTEEQKKKDGLYLKTLELNPAQVFMFKQFRNKKKLSFLLKLGISKMLPLSSSALYRTSSGVGVILIHKETPEAYVQAGRAIERFWLTCTSLGIAFQPITGISYLAKRVRAEDMFFTNEEKVSILNADSEIQAAFAIMDTSIGMVFRFGYAPPPSAYSSKQEVEKFATL